MSDVLEDLCDLIETRSALHSLPRRKLWAWAFQGILDGKLLPQFPDGISLESKFSLGGRLLCWRRVINDGLEAIRHRHSDPSRWRWTRALVFPPVSFDHWLKDTLRGERFPARPKRRTGAKLTKRAVVKNFLDKRKRLVEGCSYKEIAKQVKEKCGIDVSPKTVGRAFGRK
jgi:hypothetical protein